jgi:hypothetical protein
MSIDVRTPVQKEIERRKSQIFNSIEKGIADDEISGEKKEQTKKVVPVEKIDAEKYHDKLEKGEISEKLAYGYGSGNDQLKFTKTGAEIKAILPGTITKLESTKTEIEAKMAALAVAAGCEPTEIYSCSGICKVELMRYPYNIASTPYDSVAQKYPDSTDEQKAMCQYNELTYTLKSVMEDCATCKVILKEVEDKKKYDLSVSQLVAISLGDDLSKGEETDELEKAEGSRGGKIIGHTKSGKAIYEAKDSRKIEYFDNSHSEHHRNFDSKDHDDAAQLHRKNEKDYKDAGEDQKSADSKQAAKQHEWNKKYKEKIESKKKAIPDDIRKIVSNYDEHAASDTMETDPEHKKHFAEVKGKYEPKEFSKHLKAALREPAEDGYESDSSEAKQMHDDIHETFGDKSKKADKKIEKAITQEDPSSIVNADRKMRAAKIGGCAIGDTKFDDNLAKSVNAGLYAKNADVELTELIKSVQGKTVLSVSELKTLAKNKVSIFTSEGLNTFTNDLQKAVDSKQITPEEATKEKIKIANLEMKRVSLEKGFCTVFVSKTDLEKALK